MIKRILLITLLLSPEMLIATENELTVSHQSWLSLCNEKMNKLIASKKYFLMEADSKTLDLYITDTPIDACDSVSLPVNGQDILWSSLISEEKSKSIDDRVVLQGNGNEDTVSISEIIVPETYSATAAKEKIPVALNTNLLSDLKLSVFGIENRGEVIQKNDRLVFNCKAGQQHAGLNLEIQSARLPKGIRADITLAYSANQTFSLSISDEQSIIKESPVHLDWLASSPAITTTHIEIPFNRINTATTKRWTLHCPSEQASIEITNFRLAAQYIAQPTRRGMWIWQPNAWQKEPELLFKKLASVQAREVYVSVPIDSSSSTIINQEALEHFVHMARKNDVDVWIVEGDPHIVLQEQWGKFTKRAEIYAQYNRLVDEVSRIRGIQYDIEPYLLPGYQLNEPQWIAAYVETIKKLSMASNLPLDLVIPFWWNKQTYQGEYFLDALMNDIERVTVMNYRTDMAQLRKFAEPFLIWGDMHERNIRMALEFGPIGDETGWRYNADEKGELWLVPIANKSILVLMKRAGHNPYGKQFRMRTSYLSSGKNITYAGNEQAGLKIIEDLERHWSAYGSYSGLSLHGYGEGE